MSDLDPTPEQAAEWREYGFDAGEIKAWRSWEFELVDAIAWRNVGFDADTAANCYSNNVHKWDGS